MQVQAMLSIQVQGGGDGEVGSHLQDRAAEPPAGAGVGQEVEQGSGPPGAAQGNLQGQACNVHEEEEVTGPGWAVQYFPGEEVGRVAGPYFRLPTQPKVVEGWGGHGSAVDPHCRLPTQPKVAEGGGVGGQQGSAAGQVGTAAGIARNSTEKEQEAGDEDDAEQAAGRDDDAGQAKDADERKKETEAKNITERKNEKRGNGTGDEKDRET